MLTPKRSPQYRLYLSATMAACIVVANATLQAQVARTAYDPRGCWELSRPAGPAAEDSPSNRDSRYRTLWLRDSGEVRLPELEAREARNWRSASGWTRNADTLFVRVFTGLQGWQLSLLPVNATRFSGTGTYLSDVIVRGQPPYRVSFSATRIACKPEWTDAAELPVAPLLEQPFFAHQVSQRARLRSSLPQGVRSFTELSESTRAKSDSIGVTVQFVVNSKGRVQ